MFRKPIKNHAVRDFFSKTNQINKVMGTVLQKSCDWDLRTKRIRLNQTEFSSSVVGRARKTDPCIWDQLEVLEKTSRTSVLPQLWLVVFLKIIKYLGELLYALSHEDKESTFNAAPPHE